MDLHDKQCILAKKKLTTIGVSDSFLFPYDLFVIKNEGKSGVRPK